MSARKEYDAVGVAAGFKIEEEPQSHPETLIIKTQGVVVVFFISVEPLAGFWGSFL